MWKKILTIIASLMLLTGMGFLLFPPVSNHIGKLQAESISDTFDKSKESAVETYKDVETAEEAREKGYIDEEGYQINEEGVRISEERIVFAVDLERLYNDSVAYNNRLKKGQGTVYDLDYSEAVLDLSDYGIYDGVYCYISAPTIGMRLPVYLGANDYMMSYGAAHLASTSLPLNDTNTNCAIAGHTGYIGRIFFDNLRGLSIGDTVTITNYWDQIDYQVIETKVVLPNNSSDVYIKKDRQLLTLITCVPAGNGLFNRYLVICEKQ